MTEEEKLVAVFEIPADSNEDNWSYAISATEQAVRQAAIEAGVGGDQPMVEVSHTGVVALSTTTGRLVGRVVTKEGLPSWTAPRRVL
ncbi:hypothetical protein O7606_00090 [Micromonospora sp. WMMD882]|uniref:hypothetical protein n=1 Tax=Micromonospora sp. WMMD882 TaxID=3015151 RepID=UPI00248B77DB|nr:hypothetical protein [Micromonospora sp. WMMD882]WBB79852.1 hypothetical protein O7606_00090 [Micromonospora sp. WMMD882]